MAACAGEDAPRALSAAAVGHLICARTIGCGMCFFSARWREGPEDCSTGHKSGIIGVYAAGRGMMRRACFALRVIEAPQSAAAQPASASLWDLLLCWLARRGPAGGGIIGMYGGVRGG